MSSVDKNMIWQDLGGHLMSLLETDRILEQENKLKNEVTQLQIKAEKLKKRRDNLKRDLIRNVNSNKNNSTGPLLPIKLADYSNSKELDDQGASHALHSNDANDQEASEILAAFRRSQAMQAYAICHGVTTKATMIPNIAALGTFGGEARLASYQFHPVSEKSGKIHGPFEIVLANKPVDEGAICLFSYSFPEPGDPEFKPPPKPVLVTDRQRKINRDDRTKSVVPIEDLEDQFLTRKSTLDKGNVVATGATTSRNVALYEEKHEYQLDRFVRAVSDHLSAYISRMDQVQELLPKNGSTKADCGEVFNVKFSRDISLVKFVLKLEDSSEDRSSNGDGVEDDNDLLLKISMEYDGDGRRPRQGCVKIKISGGGKDRYNKDDLDSLDKQCEVFYTDTIAEGIRGAFVE